LHQSQRAGHEHVNTFDQPSNISIKPFDGAKVEGGSLRVVLPPKSVVMLDLQ
jgi:alpha-N-arabinofuranosidase